MVVWFAEYGKRYDEGRVSREILWTPSVRVAGTLMACYDELVPA